MHCYHVARRLVLGLTLLLANPWVLANTVTILTSQAGGGYAELIDALRDEITQKSGTKTHVITAADVAVSRLPADTILIVTVGLQVARQTWAIPDLKTPILSVLLPRASFEALTAPARSNQKRAALFIDQPPPRQLELLRSVVPAARNVGLVLGPATQEDLPTYRAIANARGLSLVVERADRETELYPILQSVLRAADVLLALPDSSIVNVSTAQNLLLTSFRFRVPVIGYSASYVRAGALAAVYSTPRQLGLEAGQIVRQFVRTGALPAAKYPRYFSVAVNRQVAESLGLSVPEEATIVQRLQQLESLE